jgi:Icc-related predicted phosphoesterase
MLRIVGWNPGPVLELPYRYARKGGGVAVEGVLEVTIGEVAGLPTDLDGIVLTADLQGRELLPPTRRNSTSPARNFREGRRLLGQVAAEALAGLSESSRLPAGDRLGVVLAGDFWAEPGCIRRGRSGDVRPVWEAFQHSRRWVVGVRGNHDVFREQPTAEAVGLFLLDGSSVTLDGIRFGGIGGVIGNPAKPRMRSEERFSALVCTVAQAGIDVLILHQGPSGDDESSRGNRAIRESLADVRDVLVVFGHCFWKRPFQDIGSGRQLINVDSRVIVLVRESWAAPNQPQKSAAPA